MFVAHFKNSPNRIHKAAFQECTSKTERTVWPSHAWIHWHPEERKSSVQKLKLIRLNQSSSLNNSSQSNLSTRCYCLLGINMFHNHKTLPQHKVQKPWLNIKISKRLKSFSSMWPVSVTGMITGHSCHLLVRKPQSSAFFKERWKVAHVQYYWSIS